MRILLPGRPRLLGAALASLALATGCGLEAHFLDWASGDNERRVVRLDGKLPEGATLKVRTGDGTELKTCAIGVRGEACIVSQKESAGTYALELEALKAGDYEKLTLLATAGNVTWRRLVPALGEDNPDLNVDARSTLALLLIEGNLSATGRSLQTVDKEPLEKVIGQIEERFDTEEDYEVLLAMTERVIAAGDPDAEADAPQAFQSPTLSAVFLVEQSPLNPAFLADAEVDIDDDGEVDEDSAAYDEQFGIVAGQSGIEQCLDAENLRVVLAVDFNEGKLDENGQPIRRFKWVQDGEGKSMWFVGGIHEESPVQDTEIDAMLGNNGSWAPNTVPMFDDGTNGDAVAGDNIWTASFVLPKGLRMGYKYTWGTQGQLWTGTEEWPGNQRLLEVVDVNGDNIVYRYDYFADETTNKDRSNFNGSNPSGGSVFWDTDVNGDGIPDPQERPVDLGTPNTPSNLDDDVWVTPGGIGPAIVPCEE